MKRLLQQRRRIVRALPPLEEIVRGSVVERRVGCGKPGCRCARGALHRAIYLSVTFAGGRTEQLSLPAPVVPRARRWVANYHAWWRAVEKLSAINRQLAPAHADLARRPQRAVDPLRVQGVRKQREARLGAALSRLE